MLNEYGRARSCNTYSISFAVNRTIGRCFSWNKTLWTDAGLVTHLLDMWRALVFSEKTRIRQFSFVESFGAFPNLLRMIPWCLSYFLSDSASHYVIHLRVTRKSLFSYIQVVYSDLVTAGMKNEWCLIHIPADSVSLVIRSIDYPVSTWYVSRVLQLGKVTYYWSRSAM
jgi:hypothetical protein